MDRAGPGRALLVEDGESRIALEAARALSAAGWTVGVAAPGRSMAGISRSTTATHLVPLPNDGLRPFVSALAGALEAGRYDVVFGVGDAELLAVSACRAELPAHVPYAPHAQVVEAVDKAGLSAAAVRAGLRTPQVYESDDLTAARGPLVVKPRLNGRIGHIGTSKIQARRVVGAAEAARQVAEVRAAGGDPLVQEAVEGELMAVVVLLAPEGRLVASAQQRADRLYPPGAGFSTRARTEPVDQVLLGKCSRMLRDMGWWGVAELQFVAPVQGDPALIDLNGRFYGSMALARAAGVNLPDLWARMTMGEQPASVEARPGVRYQWLEGDLRRALQERNGGLVRDVLECLRVAPGSQHSTWQRSDPRPFTRQAGRILARGVRKATRGRR